MSHVQNHIQIPSLKRNLSGGAVGSNAPPMNNNHMSMSAAASLSALASGGNGAERSNLTQSSTGPPHRHEASTQHAAHTAHATHTAHVNHANHAPHANAHGHPVAPHAHAQIAHAYPPAAQHDRYHPGPPQHSAQPPAIPGPPTIQRAATSSSVYGRQPITTRVPTTSVPGPPGLVSRPSQSATPSTASQDWRMYLTIEERQAVRSKIHDAYTSTCKTYEELLQAASAIEEELLHIAAPSRLDYFKSGFEFENRVKLKQEQLQGQLAALEKKRSSDPPKASPEAATKKSRKQQGQQG